MNIDIIAGARPNFMKISPIIDSINDLNSKYKLSFRLIHTGQHYDENMSGSFFKQLGIPLPDINLEVGSGTQAEQTANIMIKYEKLLLKNKIDLCFSRWGCYFYYGLYCSKKMNVKVAHIEAGIRSHDLSMPESNKQSTDYIGLTLLKMVVTWHNLIKIRCL